MEQELEQTPLSAPQAKTSSIQAPQSPEQPVLHVAGGSPLSRWTKGPQAARDRIHRGVTIPEWQPSFQIAPDAQVFAIGSCFARNIESELLRLGVRVTSAETDSELLEIRTNLHLGLLNKYNPASIHQELAWAAEISPFPAQGFVESQGKYVDPYLREQTRGGNLATVQAAGLHSRPTLPKCSQQIW